MDPRKLKHSLGSGSIPKKDRMLIAAGLAPIPAAELLDLVLFLCNDPDGEIRELASKTLASWEESEIGALARDPGCPESILEYFSRRPVSGPVQQAILSNAATPDAAVAAMASTVPARLLETILDNRIRILRAPEILDAVRRNPAATPEMVRLADEIRADFLEGTKSEYGVGEETQTEPEPESLPELEFAVPDGDLSLEGLPVDPEERQSEIVRRLSSMPMREKLRYAMFGTREVRSMLVRDTNKEVARAVLRSPKLTDNEVEAIAAMRGVAEDVLREIGRSRTWTKSYATVQNLVKNPKTPPAISQGLIVRLHAAALTLLSRDRSVPEAVRYNAARTLRQRAGARKS